MRKALTLRKKYKLLLKLCLDYKNRLEKKILREYPDHSATNIRQIKNKKVAKWQSIKKLIAQLSANENDDVANYFSSQQSLQHALLAFTIELNKQKPILIEHRDTENIVFLKNVSFILAFSFFGTGFFISYCQKNSFKFWKSNGEILVDAINKILAAPLEIAKETASAIAIEMEDYYDSPIKQDKATRSSNR